MLHLHLCQSAVSLLSSYASKISGKVWLERGGGGGGGGSLTLQRLKSNKNQHVSIRVLSDDDDDDGKTAAVAPT